MRRLAAMRRLAVLPAVVAAGAVLLPSVAPAVPAAGADGRAVALVQTAAPACSGLERIAVGKDAAGEREAGAARQRSEPGSGTGRAAAALPRAAASSLATVVRSLPVVETPEPSGAVAPRSPPTSS